jgi:hypothetical protein
MLDRTGKLLIINPGENTIVCTVHNILKNCWSYYTKKQILKNKYNFFLNNVVVLSSGNYILHWEIINNK